MVTGKHFLQESNPRFDKYLHYDIGAPMEVDDCMCGPESTLVEHLLEQQDDWYVLADVIMKIDKLCSDVFEDGLERHDNGEVMKFCVRVRDTISDGLAGDN